MRWLTNRQPAAVNNVMTGTPLIPSQPTVNNFAGALAVPAGSYRNDAPFVTRVPLQNMEYLYSYGAQNRAMSNQSTATDGVNSSSFQGFQVNMFDASFNHSLYLGVYPQNTGISFKVGTVAKELKRGDGPKMGAQPQMFNSVFTRRAYNTAPSIVAKPAAS